MTAQLFPGGNALHVGIGDPDDGLRAGSGLGSSDGGLAGAGVSDGLGALQYLLDQSRPITLSFLPAPQDPGGATAPAPTVSVVEDYGTGNSPAEPWHGDFSARNFFGGTGGTSAASVSGGGGTWSQNNGAGLTFFINYDSSVNNAPSGFKAGFQNAVQYFLNSYASANASTPLTITLNVGWGEVGGQRLSPFALGESSTYLGQVGYSQLYNALHNEAYSTSGSVDQQTAVGSLPASGSPINGATFWLSTANEKALGLIVNNSTADGSVGFGSKFSWDFNTGTQPASNQYDFTSVAEHEISEVMGRIALLGGNVGGVPNSYSNMDLFRYSAAGTRALSAGQTAFLSFDGGNTPLNYFNTASNGDAGDWQSSGVNSAGNDAYDAFANSGIAYSVSSADTRALNVLGYALHPTTTTV